MVDLKAIVDLSLKIIKDNKRRADLVKLLFVILLTSVFFLVISARLFDKAEGVFVTIAVSTAFLLVIVFTWWVTSWFPHSFFVPSNKYEYKEKPTDWLYQGDFHLTKEDFSITNSDAGCILKNRIYRDYKMEFNFRIENDSGFGLIYRARSMGEYYMFKIQPNQAITPHYRNDQGWEILGDPESDNKIEGLVIGEWYSFSLSVKGNFVVIKILKGGKSIYEYQYFIPSHSILNYRFQTRVVQDEKFSENLLVIPVLLQRGSVGFRAYGNEKVTVMGLKIISE